MAEAEFAATVHELRATLGAPYAEVLDLHLDEGLNAKQIALRLDRPAGTVRTQLVRALELLRKQLPSGFVAGMLLSVTATAASVAAVRASVMGKAAAVATGAGVRSAAATIVSLIMGKKSSAVILAVTLLLGSGVWMLVANGDGAGHLPPSSPPAAATGDSAALAGSPGPVVDATTSREAVPRTTPTADDASTAWLVVSVTWQHDGSPATSVGMRAIATPRNSLYERHGLTDTNGVVHLDGIRPGRCWLVSAFTELQVIELVAGATQTVALMAKRDGIVHGVVVDGDGRCMCRHWCSAPTGCW